jgi:hypothetical protein
MTWTMALIAAGLIAVSAVGGYFKGQRDEAVGWAEAVAAQDAEIQQFKDDSAKREATAKSSAANALIQLAAAKKEAERQRAKANSVNAEWTAYLDRMQHDAGRGESDGEIALTSCRADAAAARGALSTVLAAALNIREVAVANTDVLKALQEWVRGQTD